MTSDPWQVPTLVTPTQIVWFLQMQSLPLLQCPLPRRQDLLRSSCCCPSALRQLTRLLIVNIPVIQVLMVFIQPSRLSPEQGLFSFISWEMSYVLNILLLTLSAPAPLMSLRDMPGPCPLTHSVPQLSGHPSSSGKTPSPPRPPPGSVAAAQILSLWTGRG